MLYHKPILYFTILLSCLCEALPQVRLTFNFDDTATSTVEKSDVPLSTDSQELPASVPTFSDTESFLTANSTEAFTTGDFPKSTGDSFVEPTPFSDTGSFVTANSTEVFTSDNFPETTSGSFIEPTPFSDTGSFVTANSTEAFTTGDSPKSTGDSFVEPTLSYDTTYTLPEPTHTFCESCMSSLTSELHSLPTELPDGCGSADWEPTPENWVSVDVDQKMSEWWDSADKSKGDFVSQLFSSFGGRAGAVQCGIYYLDSCPLPTCESFRASNDPQWAYFAQIAVVRINTLFNLAYAGISDGQGNLNSLIPNLVSLFKPYKDNRSDLRKALPWISLVVEGLVGAIPGVGAPAAGAVRKSVAGGGKSLAEGAAKTLKIAADKNSDDPSIQRDGNIEELGVAIRDTSDMARKTLDSWLSVLLSGKRDPTGKTIFGYMKSGAYTLPLRFTLPQVTLFYTNIEIAKVWNEQVRQKTKTFVLCADSSGPKGNASLEYYDATSKKRCKLFRLDGKDAHFTELFGVDPGLSEFKISAADVSASSWRAYRDSKKTGNIQAKFVNLTVHDSDRVAFDDSLAAAYASTNTADESPESQQPLNQGVKFGGVFNIPVCDVGDKEDWLSGDKYPCCCGKNCIDQPKFMEFSNMGGWGPVKNKCKTQYSGYKSVDYGSNAVALARSAGAIWWALAVGFIVPWLL